MRKKKIENIIIVTERKLNLIYVFAIIICNCKLLKMTECICAVCVCSVSKIPFTY